MTRIRKMSLSNVTPVGKLQQVACLACNSKVAISFAKHIYKTAFAHTGETLAYLVRTTLSLDAADNLPSSHLCLQCVNYFGKLDLAQRKVKSIKSEILKIYQNNRNLKENSTNETTPNVARLPANPICTSQVPTSSCKPKAVISQCINTSTIVTEASSHSSDTDNNSCDQSNEEDIVNLNAGSINNNNEFDFSRPCSSLIDHQYSLQPAKANPRKLDANPKTQSVLQQQNKVGTTISAVIKTVPESQNKIRIAKSKYYAGPHCNKKEKTLTELKQHRQQFHAQPHSYICKKCGKVCKSQKALDIHVNLHNGIGPFTCTVCSKCFTKTSALKRHLSVHTTSEESDESRNMYLKKFIDHSACNSALLQNQEKIHKCNLCSMAFTTAWRLKRHTRIHTGDRQHRCELCEKRFYDRCSVVSHMKVHDPERIRLKEIKSKQKRHVQRRCERCNINFDSMGKYTVHLHSHTPENVIAYCKINYTRVVN